MECAGRAKRRRRFGWGQDNLHGDNQMKAPSPLRSAGALHKALSPGAGWAQLGITLQTGLREIWAHKFRSLLTMLGIVLGVSSLVAVSALVAGMEKGAKEG